MPVDTAKLFLLLPIVMSPVLLATLLVVLLFAAADRLLLCVYSAVLRMRRSWSY